MKFVTAAFAAFLLIVAGQIIGVPAVEANPLCQTPDTTVIVLDTTTSGRFIRRDVNGNAISAPFNRTDVWILGAVEDRVRIQVTPSAATVLKGNTPLSFTNRTNHDLCIDLDLTLAAAELSTDVFFEGDILQIGRRNLQPINIDLTTIDTLTIGSVTLSVDELTQANVGQAIAAARVSSPITGDICGTITVGMTAGELRTAINTLSSANHVPITYSQARDFLRDLDADPAVPGNVLLFYFNRSQSRMSFESDNGSPIPRDDRWNREHLWPQSHGARQGAPNSDLFHIRAEDKTINSARGNQDFGEVPEINPNRVINNTDGVVLADTFQDNAFWEPRDEIKGDIARAMFYMDVRYEGRNGDPDLVLVAGDSPDDVFQMGDLVALLAWAQQDPVSPEEVSRELAVAQIQGNRNPFIACAAQIDVNVLFGTP